MRKNNQITKYIMTLVMAMVISLTAYAQVPYINSISPTSAGVGQIINIAGSNFTGATAVYFGGTQGDNLTVVNTNLITIEVPFGATFDQVSVRHSSGTGYSPQKFNPTFDGASITDAANMLNEVSAQEAFVTGKTQTQDLCLCDFFGGDGTLDVAVSNAGSPDISVFTNNSVVGNADFTSTTLSNSFPVTNVICGDLDGDGWPDLVANELNGEAKIYTYRNDGAGSFEPKEFWTIPTTGGLFRKPGRIAMADLDLDGKPELVINVEDENMVFIFKNQSTSSNIDFNPTPLSLEASESAGTSGLGGLDVADLNNDGFPEIISSNFTEKGFYVFQNNSTPGTITFNTPLFTNTNSSIRALQTGDLNQDGFADVVLTNSDITSSDIIEIAENTTGTTGSDVDMNIPIQVLGLNTTWGLDLGDVDGDGDLDIAVASFGSNNGFYTVINTNPASIAPGSYSVGLVAESGTNNSRNIKIADIDSDSRPDFVYTNRSTAEGTGNLATRLNEVCFEPVITPVTSVKLCTGESADLIASGSGYEYTWKKDGTDVVGQTTNTLNVTEADAGTYTVLIKDNCQNISAQSVVVTAPGASHTTPVISVNGGDLTPCEGDDVVFNIDTENATVDTYLWSGPNGFTSSSSSLTVSGISTDQSGDYTLTTIETLGCQKTSNIINLSTVATPIVTVNNPKPDSFCSGNDLDLSTNDFGGSYTYDWKLNDATTGQSDPASFTTSAAGDYSVTITGSGCSYTSASRTLTTVAPPTSAFTASDAVICTDVDVDFTASSTGDASLTVVNYWNYKDGSSIETGNAVSHAFSTAATYDVALTAKYDGIEDADCTYTPATTSVEVQTAPTDLDLIISDNSDPNNFEKCKESALRLRVSDTYTSYHWVIGTDTLGTNAVYDASNEGDVYVQLVNAIKCPITSNAVTVSNYTTGGISITASSPNTVTTDATLGNIVNMEEGQSTVTLTVENATEPAWEPALYINDTTLTTVDITVSNKQLISVYGLDNLGCQEKDSVTLIFPGVNAAKSFTPNGDGIGDCWEVSNVGSTDCQVVIFDNKGRRIRDISFSPDGGADDCVWDGNKSNGSALPDGMYYYFISCSDSGNESSGSIFMAR